MEYRNKKKENVVDVITKVGKVLGVKIEKEHIDACHRLGAIKGGETRGVFVKFTRRSKKERKIKRSLSPARRKFLNRAIKKGSQEDQKKFLFAQEG